MIKIALCDDSHSDMCRTAELIGLYIRRHTEHEFALQVFSSPFELLSRIEDGQFYHIYLLDILMPSLTGIELGRRLREHDNRCSIIFCTITAEFALESYNVCAQNYLIKPFGEEALFRSLDQAMTRLEQQQAAGICVRTEDGLAFLPYYQIIYIELVRRRLVFHMTDARVVQSLLLRGSLEAALVDLLSESRFLQPHKSFVVNMDHVILWGGNRLLLCGDVDVPISLRRRGIVQDRSFAYLAKQKGEIAVPQSRSFLNT